MQVNFNTQNFRGYKNLLHTDLVSYPNSRFLMMSMQLNDEDGHNDLSYFKKMFRDFNLPETDVISLIYAKPTGSKARYILNNVPLLSSKELAFINNSPNLEFMTKNDCKAAEKFNIRAYTLLAQLTKRLMNISMVSSDGEMQHTIQVVADLLKESLSTVNNVMSVIMYAVNEKKPFQKSALEINRRIDSRMQKYLKLIG